MPTHTDETALLLEKLNQRVQQLETRVAALEPPPLQLEAKADTHRLALVVPPPKKASPPATWRGFPPLQTTSDSGISVIGKAVLGMAGAYLLRAITESGSVSKLPVMILAIIYASLWMGFAIRIHATKGFASITYGITSAMILSPLLWESTVRFQLLSPAMSAAVLVAFVVLTLLLTWRCELYLLPWVATLATLITTLALILATHDLVPLTAVLLVAALVTEISACLGHHLTLRPAPAVAANLAILVLIDVMTSSEGVPEGYHHAAPSTIAALCLALLAIYGSSIGYRTFQRRETITIVEIVQGVLSFVIATFGALRATNGSIAPLLGVFFLLLAAVCYWGTLVRFTDSAYTRNRRVFATWAAGLLIAGSMTLFPVLVRGTFLSFAAVLAAFMYKRTAKVSLGLHASLYLMAAAVASPMLDQVIRTLTKSVPAAPNWHVAAVAISAAICYSVGLRLPENRGRYRALWLVPALLTSFAVSAFIVAVLVWIASGRVQLVASRMSVIRTIVNCGLAVALAFLGSRWKRVELGWVAYTAVGFGTLKILFEDLRYGNAASLVLSLFFYGLVLILLPRLAYRDRREDAEIGMGSSTAPDTSDPSPCGSS
jgi:hypothetical protein